ncbi:MAG TPA: hypothetical protein VF821_08100 [Lentzea sp.]
MSQRRIVIAVCAAAMAVGAGLVPATAAAPAPAAGTASLLSQSTRILVPATGQTVRANAAFTVKVLVAGTAVSPRVVVQRVTTNQAPDPSVWAFQGTLALLGNGIHQLDVGNGLPAGSYRLCTVSLQDPTQYALGLGPQDDCVYFGAR